MYSNAQTATVTLDNFYNHEFQKDDNGELKPFHYIWEDKTQNGYSIWGDIFRKNGARIKMLREEPTASRLQGTDIYIITDPDTENETQNPNYIQSGHIKAIAEWVKEGGVLVLMANDSANTELKHFNQLAEVFGIYFNNDVRNMVTGYQYEMGTFHIPKSHPVFTAARKIYIKQICTLKLSGNARSLLTDGEDVIMAASVYGKGTVFAVGDPWFYNEYTNGNLPAGYDNDKACDDLTKWLLKQTYYKRVGTDSVNN